MIGIGSNSQRRGAGRSGTVKNKAAAVLRKGGEGFGAEKERFMRGRDDVGRGGVRGDGTDRARFMVVVMLEGVQGGRDGGDQEQ